MHRDSSTPQDVGFRVSRRGFLGAILAAAVAPAIVRADSLMRIMAPETTIQLLDEDFTAMISRVLRERAPEIQANIVANNKMLNLLEARIRVAEKRFVRRFEGGLYAGPA